MIQALLFDKDGTLLDFHATWHRALGRLFSQLGNDAVLPPEGIAILKRVSGYRCDGFEAESIIQRFSNPEIVDAWMQAMAREGSDPVLASIDPDGQLRARLSTLLAGVAEKEAASAGALSHVPEVLAELQRLGYPMGIATADTAEHAERSLDHAGIRDYFCFVGGAQGMYRPKPHPDMADAFCRQLRVAPENLLVVGDSSTDLAFACNAGAHFAGIVTQYNVFVVENTPTGVFITDFRELLGILNANT